MNVLKHMEALFLVAALITGVSLYASAESYKAGVRAEMLASATTANMAVVHVVGKRIAPASRVG